MAHHTDNPSGLPNPIPAGLSGERLHILSHIPHCGTFENMAKANMGAWDKAGGDDAREFLLKTMKIRRKS
jgi:hypothetical protein